MIKSLPDYNPEFEAEGTGEKIAGKVEEKDRSAQGDPR
jgi:hypothetical protein